MSVTLSPLISRHVQPQCLSSSQPAARPQAQPPAADHHDAGGVTGIGLRIYNRFTTFASDTLNGLQGLGALGACGVFGAAGHVASAVFGPVAAGIGMAIGSVEVARGAFAKNNAEKIHRMASGGLDMAIGAATLAATFSPVPGIGLIAVGGLIAAKLLWQACKSPQHN
jgi:hypothetical protein